MRTGGRTGAFADRRGRWRHRYYGEEEPEEVPEEEVPEEIEKGIPIFNTAECNQEETVQDFAIELPESFEEDEIEKNGVYVGSFEFLDSGTNPDCSVAN